MRLLEKIVFFIVFVSIFTHHTYAQTLPSEPNPPQEHYVKAKVEQVIKEGTFDFHGYKTFIQTLKLRILSGPEKDTTITVERGNDVKISANQRITAGQTVIVDVLTQGNTKQYTITDIYRLSNLWYLAGAFFFLTILFAGKKGLGALLGLGISLFVIMTFIVPQILNHHDPLLISIAGSIIILVATTYLAHGFSKTTSIAVLSTFISLLITCLFSLLAVHIAHLAGLGTEDSYLLEITPGQNINPQGLLLGGIIIGTLGALNDITTTQVVTIFSLFKHNSKLKFLELAEQGFVIGREHIVSLVNTLVLAYAGSALTIFIFFVLNPAHLPWWVIVNNESVSEEIIRTIAGSTGLILAVPITTFLASWIAFKTHLHR